MARFSGPTIHFVDEHYDTGRILAQRVVPVLPDDTAENLAARVLGEVVTCYIKIFRDSNHILVIFELEKSLKNNLILYDRIKILLRAA